MTLQTTRIDTLYPHGDDNNLIRNNVHASHGGQPQEMLLVDFVPNGTNVTNNTRISHGATPTGTTTMVPNRFNGYPVQLQQPLPLSNHVTNNHNNIHNNNDLHNYTLVNLSNQPELGDDDEEDDQGESQVFFNGHIPLKRSSIPTTAVGNVKVSSSMSSSSSTDDSDTGFLVPQNNGIKGKSAKKDNHYKLQSSVPPSTSYPGSPGFNSVQQSHRKRLRRRRSSGRRKPYNQPKHDESTDFISLCCCFGDDEHQSHRSSHTGHSATNSSTSLTNRYIRYSCAIVMIIALATFASIMVSLQRKVDSLSWEVKKFSTSPTTATNQASPNQSLSIMQNLIVKHDQLNTSYSLLTKSLDELNQRVINLEKQTKGLPPSVEEVRKDLATLGSELEGSIKEMQKELQDFKNANAKNEEKPKVEEDTAAGAERDTATTTLSSGGPT